MRPRIAPARHTALRRGRERHTGAEFGEFWEATNKNVMRAHDFYLVRGGGGLMRVRTVATQCALATLKIAARWPSIAERRQVSRRAHGCRCAFPRINTPPTRKARTSLENGSCPHCSAFGRLRKNEIGNISRAACSRLWLDGRPSRHICNIQS